MPTEPPRKRCSPGWARLIAKVYQVDPLVCTGCGERMSLVAFVATPSPSAASSTTSSSTAEAEKPPPLREVLHVAEVGAWREVGPTEGSHLDTTRLTS